MNRSLFAALTLAAWTGLVRPAPAQVVVFNSFGAGNTYSHATVWAVKGAATSGGYRGQAEFFTPDISGDLYSIMLATYRVSGSALSNFYLAEDNGSGSPGAILESFNNMLNVTGLLTLNSTVKPLLLAGEKYWLCDEPAAGSSYNGWYYNNLGLADGFAFDRAEWGWSAVSPPAPSSGVFQISVTPVPEPASATLGLFLGGGLFLFNCRRKSGR